MKSVAVNCKIMPKSFFLYHVKYEHLVAGISGGVSSTLILHPFDLLKIRFAVNEGLHDNRPHYKGIVHAVSTIVKEEGIRGLYRGVSPNCLGAGSSWGLYFLFYNALKTRMLEHEPTPYLGPGQHMLAAAESGALTLLMTNPIWVIKTRLCLQYNDTVTVPNEIKYKGMTDAFIKLYKYEGIRGLYKGFVPGLFGVSHGALQFMVYEELKKFYIQYYDLQVNDNIGTLEYLSFAAVSKVFAASATFPYQVIRARLQDQHRQYKGIFDVTLKTFQFEGFRGFYKGLWPSLLKVTPATAITFVVYENVSHFLLSQSQKK